jgi:hypothetical protein
LPNISSQQLHIEGVCNDFAENKDISIVDTRFQSSIRSLKKAIRKKNGCNQLMLPSISSQIEL